MISFVRCIHIEAMALASIIRAQYAAPCVTTCSAPRSLSLQPMVPKWISIKFVCFFDYRVCVYANNENV